MTPYVRTYMHSYIRQTDKKRKREREGQKERGDVGWALQDSTTERAL